MKTILEFINTSHDYGVDYAIIKEQYYNDLCWFFNDSIPNDILEKYNNNQFVDYLYENLLTHDIKKLQNKLLKEYPDFEFNDYESGSFYIITDKVFDLKKDEDFKSLIEFYGYYISDYEWKFGDKKGMIYIEPNETEDKTNYVYKNCHGICYHICKESVAEKILKSGLRCKEARYRKYPKRIFLYATDKNIKNNDDFKKLANTLKSPYNNEKLVCLKIDLNKLTNSNIKIMKDPAMHNKGSLYTYTNIPKEIISKTNIDL